MLNVDEIMQFAVHGAAIGTRVFFRKSEVSAWVPTVVSVIFFVVYLIFPVLGSIIEVTDCDFVRNDPPAQVRLVVIVPSFVTVLSLVMGPDEHAISGSINNERTVFMS